MQLTCLRSVEAQNGDQCRREAAEADQVPGRVQSKGGHEKGQCRSDEEVSGHPRIRILNCGQINGSLSRWIAGKLSEILGNEDDVVIELCFNLLEGARFVGFYWTFAVAVHRLVTD